MKYRLAAAAMSLAAALTATPASAQMPQAPIGVYDANNKFVGRYFGIGALLLNYNNRWYITYFDHGGLDADITFYYASSNCTGQKLLYNSSMVPKQAQYEEETSTFWVQTNFDITLVEVNSYSYAGGSHCGTIYGKYSMSPALALDTHVSFKPPFTVR